MRASTNSAALRTASHFPTGVHVQLAGTAIDRNHVRRIDDNSLYRLHDRIEVAVTSTPAGSTQIDRVRVAGVQKWVVQELERRSLPR
jgi:hypothetical protein